MLLGTTTLRLGWVVELWSGLDKIVHIIQI